MQQPRPEPVVEPSAEAPTVEPEVPTPEPAPPLPDIVRISVDDEKAIADIVADAIELNQTPGAVVVLGRRDGVVFQRAYGAAQVEPDHEPMRESAIFDLASVTKIFTAISAMQLIQAERISLDESVDAHLPELAGRGIRVRHLLLHTSGLPSVNPLSDFDDATRAEAIHRALQTASLGRPGRYEYSDLGFIALGELVSRVSGLTLQDYVQEHILRPLEMTETGYALDDSILSRAVPTEYAPRRAADGQPPPMIRGEVNDPRAWRLSSVAGHAGLFASASDLAKLARALLRQGAPILEPASFRAMVTPSTLRRRSGAGTSRRGLGFEMSRWEPSSPASFGHGGYTGGWIWVDPEADAFVLIMTNRVHPNGEGNAGPLRRRLLPIALGAIRRAGPPVEAPVALGVDVLRRDGFGPLQGKNVAVFTNNAGRARDGKPTWQLVRDAPGVTLKGLFAPEHGLDGDREGRIPDGTREGIPVYSLFGARRDPPAESLRGVDTIVVDLQDAGVRFYTYAASVGRLLQAAAEHHIKILILDRPNPIDGSHVEGPITDDEFRSFVNHHPLPVRHGMTMGELARFLVQERELDVEVEVIPLEGWSRSMRWPQTGLRWVPPSPNLRTPSQVLLYPALGLLEAANVSVGRGTDKPFELVGAPWIATEPLMESLAQSPLPGVRFQVVRFTPTQSRHRGRLCSGVSLELTDPDAFRPVRTGLALAAALKRWPTWDLEAAGRLIADRAVLEALGSRPMAQIEAIWTEELEAFRVRRERVLLYR